MEEPGGNNPLVSSIPVDSDADSDEEKNLRASVQISKSGRKTEYSPRPVDYGDGIPSSQLAPHSSPLKIRNEMATSDSELGSEVSDKKVQ